MIVSASSAGTQLPEGKSTEDHETALDKSKKQDLEAGGLTGAVRAVTAWFRSILAQPRVRLFTPRRFQALHLIRGGSVKPEQSAIPTVRQIFREEGVRGLTKRVALPLAANTASGTALFSTYGAVEGWAAACISPDSNAGLLALLRTPQQEQHTASNAAPSVAHAHGHAVPLSCVAFAGAVAGGVHAVVTCPLDNYLSQLHAASVKPSPTPTPALTSTPPPQTQKAPPLNLQQHAPSTSASHTATSASRSDPPMPSHSKRNTFLRRWRAVLNLKHHPRAGGVEMCHITHPSRPNFLRAQASACILSHAAASTSTSALVSPARAHAAHTPTLQWCYAPALRPSATSQAPAWLAGRSRGPWIVVRMRPLQHLLSTLTIAPSESTSHKLRTLRTRVLETTLHKLRAPSRLFSGAGGVASVLQFLREECVGSLGSASSVRSVCNRQPWDSWTSSSGVSTSPLTIVTCQLENGGLSSGSRVIGLQGAMPCGGLRGMATSAGKTHSVHSRHLFTGLGISMTRDTTSYGVFFLTYEYTKARILAWNPTDMHADPEPHLPSAAAVARLLRRPPGSKHASAAHLDGQSEPLPGSGEAAAAPSAEGRPHEELSLLGTILAGAVSGATFRLVSFPIDWGREFWSPHPGNAPPHPLSAEAAVRSRLHVHAAVRGGTWRSVRMLRRIYGPGSGFLSGLGWSIAGSVPAAALTFLAYEFAQQLVEE